MLGDVTGNHVGQTQQEIFARKMVISSRRQFKTKCWESLITKKAER